MASNMFLCRLPVVGYLQRPNIEHDADVLELQKQRPEDINELDFRSADPATASTVTQTLDADGGMVCSEAPKVREEGGRWSRWLVCSVDGGWWLHLKDWKFPLPGSGSEDTDWAKWVQDTNVWIDEQFNTRGAVAVMLVPDSEAPFNFLQDQPGMLRRRLRARAVVDTFFRGSPRQLFIVELDDPSANEAVHSQIQWLRQSLECSTKKPADGPWIWPLHNPDVCRALLATDLVRMTQEKSSLWRKLLWALRMLPPPGGAEKEKKVSEQYGAAVAYVFAWSNLYIRGLWALAATIIVLRYVLGAVPGTLGTFQGVAWNTLQFVTLLWCFILADAGRSRRRVLDAGGHNGHSGHGNTCRAVCLPSRHQFPAAHTPGGAVQESVVDVEALQSIPGSAGEQQTSAQLTHDSASPVLELRCQKSFKSQAAEFGADLGRKAQAKWRRAKAVVEGLSLLELARQPNLDYRPPRSWCEGQCQKFFVRVYSCLLMAIFLVLCLMILCAFVELNIYLIYSWGGCIDPVFRQSVEAKGGVCRSPQDRRGFLGWLAEVGSDVSLAILFDVLLGEVSKALARHIAYMQNYKYAGQQRFTAVMLAIVLESLSKVGMFALIGFVFLPQWAQHTSSCEIFPDYQICKVVTGCDTQLNPTCCQETLLCISRQLGFEDRQRFFEVQFNGPFVVAPFIRFLITGVIPWVAGWLEEVVTVDARDMLAQEECSPTFSQSRSPSCCRACLACLRACATPIVRILAIIFKLDAEPLGGIINYVLHGWPFGPMTRLKTDTALAHEVPSGRKEAHEAMQNALEQVSRKEFESLDELLEIKMNFLFVTFFAPIMPFGLIPTLFARILRVRSKATKLLFLRRRSWPEESQLLHQTQENFFFLISHITVVWYSGLVVVSYNPYIVDWGMVKIVLVWLAAWVSISCLMHFLAPLVRRVCAYER